jgi:type I restriction enzyme S subunit
MNDTTTRRQAHEGETAPLQNLCQSIIDCHHSTPTWTVSGKIVVRNFNIKNGALDLSNPSFTDEKTFKERVLRARPEPGDLIITREAPMGEVCVIPEGVECCLGQRMVLIKPDHEKISSKYLLYAMLSDFVQGQINQSDKTGSTVSNLRIPLLKELEIPLLQNPDEVAAVLSALDAKIDCNNRINAELEAMAKTLYDYWFVQFDFPDANGRPYKSSGGRMVYNTALKREIPEGWSAGQLGQYISFDRGVTYRKEDVCTSSTRGAIGILRATNVTGNVIDLDDLIYVPASLVGSDQIITKFSTLIVMSSGSKEHVGKNGIYFFDLPLGFGAFCSKITPAANARYFVNTFLQSSWFKTHIKNQCLGTNINNLTRYHICECPIVSANEGVLHRFEEAARALYEKMAVNTVENQQLAQLRDWLLPLLMNGQVKVA